ncbi:hypothetical protein NC651_000613 [Populus alba x Populus x berolinensis]|nr:hypothetical protein NC651_000613 [Populus alba x Populus x berolinensis]
MFKFYNVNYCFAEITVTIMVLDKVCLISRDMEIMAQKMMRQLKLLHLEDEKRELMLLVPNCLGPRESLLFKGVALLSPPFKLLFERRRLLMEEKYTRPGSDRSPRDRRRWSSAFQSGTNPSDSFLGVAGRDIWVNKMRKLWERL